MSQENAKQEETRGSQAGSKGQMGKGQSNPGGFDQQSSSSMEKQQEEQRRASEQQRKNSKEDGD